MRILLTDGSGLTSRQVSRRLHVLGHEVGIVSSDPTGIARFSKAVTHWHGVTAFGPDPLGWLDQCLDIYRSDGYDLLFPTQEQVAVLAAFPQRLAALDVVTAVPDLEALSQVQDKASASATLERLGIGQPCTVIARTSEELADWHGFPGFVKAPIGTASGGVWPVQDESDLTSLANSVAVAEAFAGGGVVLQERVEGPLVMLQSVWDDGQLVAFHANERVREGARGGASHKRSVELPEARRAIETLGVHLHWHGALSADAISGPSGPLLIDINPRLVEPANAVQSGTDLVAAMISVAQGQGPFRSAADSRVGVQTHQSLLAVLGAASVPGTRRGVAAELVNAALRRGEYANSTEECTPCKGDLRATLPLGIASAAALLYPPTAQCFAGSSVANYALTPSGWNAIRTAAS